MASPTEGSAVPYPPTTDRTTAPAQRRRTPAWAWVLCCALVVLAVPVLLHAALVMTLFVGGGDPLFGYVSTAKGLTWAGVGLVAVAVPVVVCRLTLRGRWVVPFVIGALLLALAVSSVALGVVALP